MEPQITKTPQTFWKEREAVMSNQNLNQVKSVKRIKSPKKAQDSKKLSNDIKVEDVFLNSEYFKYKSGNVSALSFCSGDNGENLRFGVSFRPKTTKQPSYTSEVIKSDTAVLAEKVKDPKPLKLKKYNPHGKETSPGETEKLLEGILSGEEKFDRDLITLITEQMFLAERELQITRTRLIETISKLNERDLEIIQLHEKIQNLQKSKKTETSHENPTKSSEDYQRLVMASEKLKKQVKDMEEFLNDYGLVWVGEKDTNPKPDFDKIVKSFERLNSVASQPKIIQTTLGAKFELPRGIPVVLYSNGLLLRDDFREYSKVSTIMFLQDVEDGYFPSELQAEFPEGVPFEVFDKRNETYNKNGKPVFQGRGNRLGTTIEGKPSSVVYLEPVKQTRLHETNSILKTHFLDRSPLRKLQKKRSRNVSVQEDRSFMSMTLSQRSISEKFEDAHGKRLKVKIRYGRDRTESFVLDILDGEKMYGFQRRLQQKLCERYHDQCIVDFESNTRSADFELHVYGRPPFRLSDYLNMYPRDVGIVDNCVVNITEI